MIPTVIPNALATSICMERIGSLLMAEVMGRSSGLPGAGGAGFGFGVGIGAASDVVGGGAAGGGVAADVRRRRMPA